MVDKLLEKLEEKRKQIKDYQVKNDLGTLKGLQEMLKKKQQGK